MLDGKRNSLLRVWCYSQSFKIHVQIIFKVEYRSPYHFSFSKLKILIYNDSTWAGEIRKMMLLKIRKSLDRFPTMLSPGTIKRSYRAFLHGKIL